LFLPKQFAAWNEYQSKLALRVFSNYTFFHVTANEDALVLALSANELAFIGGRLAFHGRRLPLIANDGSHWCKPEPPDIGSMPFSVEIECASKAGKR